MQILNTESAEKPLKTREEARSQFNFVGKSIRAWAREHGVQASTVYEVLSGRQLGEYGEAHKVAVLLGIKHGTVEQ
ncbi:DNA-binding protein [Burkholderia ambifaria]|uniref:DNA-binding protein n=1 Tax=Burkholderia ambifaria TaxID=152480 RepID=UPI0015884979|nr:DNA-binding protein [Burkholderia ambifaria]